MYAQIINNTIQHYPTTAAGLRAFYTDVALPQLEYWDDCQFLHDKGWRKVQPTEPPVYNPQIESVFETDPVLIDGVLMQSWEIVLLTTDQHQVIRQALVDQLDAAIAERLDEQARALDFESMLDAQGYVGSSIDEWNDQAMALTVWRDDCWLWFAGIGGQIGVKADILTGSETRSLTEILADMPVFITP